MKTKTFFLIAFLFACGAAFGQNAVETTSTNNDFPKNDFLKLDDDEQEIFLKKYDTELYETFKKGQNMSYAGKHLRTGGIVLSVVGGVAMIGGYVVFISDVINDRGGGDRSLLVFGIGSIVCAAGEALIIASIPLSAVGGITKRRVQNAFQEKYLSNAKPEGRFQLQLSGNGVGLAYVF